MRTLLAIFAVPLMAASLPQAGAGIDGTWRNPDASVVVRVEPCGTDLCGTVVAASPSENEGARTSGYPSLVGLRVMRDFRVSGSGRWKGTILLPKMGRSFSSIIEVVDPDHLRVSGCLIGSFLCKSQVWNRT